MPGFPVQGVLQEQVGEGLPPPAAELRAELEDAHVAAKKGAVEAVVAAVVEVVAAVAKVGLTRAAACPAVGTSRPPSREGNAPRNCRAWAGGRPNLLR